MKPFWVRIKAVLLRILPSNTYLNRLIWYGCITVVIPVLLAGSAYYHFSMKKLTDQFQADNQASLDLMKDRMETVLTNIESTSLQLSSNPSLRSAMDRPDYPTDYIVQAQILEQFQLRKNTDDLISDVIFYDAASQITLSHSYGHAKLADFYKNEAVEAVAALPEQAGWAHLPDSRESGLLSFYRQLPIMSRGQRQGSLIIQVQRDSLLPFLKSYSINLKDQFIIVLDSQNKVIIRNTPGPAMHQEDETAVNHAIEWVKADESRSNRYILHEKKGNYLLAYHRTTFGRTYVSVMPEEEMIRQLEWIRVLIVFSVIIFMLIGILLTFFSSKLAYNPIQQLMRYGEVLRRNGSEDSSKGKGNELEYIRSCLSYLNEQSQSLNQYVQNIQPDLRDRFLQRLLAAVPRGGKASVEEECGHFQMNPAGQHVVLVTKVENLQKEKRFLPSEGAVIVFAVKNVMSELLSLFPEIQGFIVDKDEREAVGILSFAEKSTAEELRFTLERYAEQVREAMKRYLNFTVSIGIGSAAGLERISYSYKEAQLALQHRLFHEELSVLFHEDMVRAGRHQGYVYPREIEGAIVEALWAGDLTQAVESLRQFSMRVRSVESYTIIFQCYQVLLSAIIHFLEEKGPLELLGENLFDQLQENQTSQEVHDWFIGVLFPLCLQVSRDLRNNSSKLMIQRVCSHITNHPDGTHSLAECAELAGVSPSYLSRIFKKEKGSSFIEYVMEFKVEKAKQLLKDTDYSITEIARIVGYSERNLNRAFQRFVQMSPKQYRQSVR